MHRFQKTATHPVRIVVFCSDYKFDPGLRTGLRNAGVDEFDKVFLPGGSGNLAAVRIGVLREATIDAIFALIGLHHITEVVLLNHQQCGAYKDAGHHFAAHTLTEEEKAFHESQLGIAEDELRTLLDERAFQRVTISTGFVWANEDDKTNITWFKRPKVEDPTQLHLAC